MQHHGEAFHAAVLAYRAVHGGTYGAAMRAVALAQPALTRSYLAGANAAADEVDDGEAAFAEGAKRSAGHELHRRAVALQQREPGLSYGAALDRMRVADPGLAAQAALGLHRASPEGKAATARFMAARR